MIMSNIKPIRTNVLVKPCESDSVSTGGIILSDAHKEESNKVEVIAVGFGTKKKEMRYKKGDIAFRVKDHGTPVEENGVLMYLMDQDAILATLN
jgi:co-chaperonin GroES (HSP10)